MQEAPPPSIPVMPLFLRTLGVPRLENDEGEPLPFPEGKSLALLAYLAIERRPVERSELAALLWPEAVHARALQSLRQSLLVVRRNLGDAVVVGTDPIRLSPGALETDLDRLLSPVPGEGLDEVVEEGGDFLQGLRFPGCRAWESWVDDTESHHRRVLGHRLFQMAEAARERGATHEAVRLTLLAVRLHPVPVRPRLLLADLHLEQADLESASRVLAEARADTEDPDILAAIEGSERRMRRLAAEGIPAAPSRELPLVGRLTETDLLRNEWRLALRGIPRCVALRGAPGSGKTRLAQECARWVAAHDGGEVRIGALAGERFLPRAYLALLVGKLLMRPGRNGVSTASDTLLRTLVPSLVTGPLLAPAPAPALGDAVRDLLGAVAHEEPLLLVLDDFHWADPESRTLVMRVIRQLRDEPVLILVLVTDSDPQNRDPHDQSLHEDLQILEREGFCHVLPVRDLSLEDTRELLKASLAPPRDPGALDSWAEEVHRLSQGNPHLVEGLLQAMVERGTLGEDGHGWRLLQEPPPLPPFFPDLVRALQKRVDSLSEAALQLASRLPVLDEAPRGGKVAESPPASRAPVGDPDPDATRELEMEGLARRRGTGVFLVHEGIIEAVRRRLPPTAVEGRGARQRRRRVRALTLGGVLVLGAGASIWSAGRTSGPLYGGGELWMNPRGAVSVVLTPPRAEGDAWEVQAPPVQLPATSLRGPFLLPDGRREWYYDAVAADGVPEVARWTPDRGATIVISRAPEDVNFAGLSPDGSHIAFLLDDPSTPEYDIGLVVARRDGSGAQTVLQAGGRMGGGGWAPDGSRLLAFILGSPDTLITVTPTGVRLEQRTASQVRAVTWCGRGGDVLFTADRPGGGAALFRWTPSSGEVRTVPGSTPLEGSIACSPDGTLAVVPETDGRRFRLVARDLTSGSVYPLPVDPSRSPNLHWATPAIPVLREVRIRSQGDSLYLGERRRLEVALTGSDGRPRGDEIHWEALEPGVVSVDQEGLVIANRAGSGRVVATAGIWRADTVALTVTSRARGEDVLLEDDFSTLDPLRWGLVGAPPPSAVELDDGAPALRLPGDGVDRDGIRSRVGFPLEDGLTVEVSVHLPLTRRDRQGFDLTLLPHVEEAGASRPASVYLAYPGEELERFDPRSIKVLVNGFPFTLTLPEQADPQDWIRFSVGIRPDGKVEVAVNGEPREDIPLHVEMGEQGEWAVQLAGASVETDLMVRDLVVWRGLR
jgi:DNA-binding SARP family transcriptional activator